VEDRVNDALLVEVEKRLADASLPPRVADCILEACMPAGEQSEKPAAPVHSRVFLDSITVEGFRGVGPPLTLSLKPGPGLTLVVGRNGTGKSSLSDALEVLLTGNSARWAAKKSKTWQEGWRNLHHPHPTEVAARLVVEGQPGYTTVTRTWAQGNALADATVIVARPGQPTAGFDSLGWQDALVSYRPFLSYSELGGLLEDGPSKLFDALNAILGLEDLSAAAKALTAARLEIEHWAKQTTTERDRLSGLLKESQDDRAAELLAAIGAKAPNLDAIADLIEPTLLTPPEGGRLDLLRRLALLDMPTSEEIAAAAERLTAAAAAAQTASTTDAGRARAVAGLLDAAVDFHRHHGDGDCPVCGKVGGLSAQWQADADTERARLRKAAATADDAHKTLVQAKDEARHQLRPPPAALTEAGDAGIDASGVHDKWLAWADAQDDHTGLAAHLTTIEQWRDDVLLVRAEAEQQLAALEDSWRLIAQAAMVWFEHARADRADAPRVKDLKAAEAWLKKTEEAIRAERFAPLAAAATDVWKALRQHSSVDIGGITLSGTTTSRRVKVNVSVDGSDGAALAVMSQGELHALALALFFPRAMLAESPFRFIVIDDPVQAMDPAKVEGLARVLERTATSHQVVVLTHDDRLPEAVRRLRIPATVMEVTRNAGSAVTVAKVFDPIGRHLDDARHVATAKDLPDDIKARVVPTLCRQALEATCVEIIRRRRLTRGDRHEDVEKVISAANKLNKSFGAPG
jgi:recombinational DNA repair ATPase RecF